MEKGRKRARQEKKSKASVRPTLPEIPDVIVHDILLRLPAMTLTRFKAVCKSWHSLFSDPKFVKAHFDVSNRSDGKVNHFQRYGIIGITDDQSITLTSINSEAVEIKNIEMKYDDNFAEVLGSCNGLLLIGTSFHTFLWNPSTGKYKKLVSLSNNLCLMYEGNYFISGLGYDSLHDEYKAAIVIHVVSSPDSFTSYDGYVYEGKHMSLYTSKTGYWKKVDYDYRNFPYNIYSHCQGITLNGAPHWVVRYDTGGYCPTNRRIIYFDVAKEKYKTVPLPKSMRKNVEFNLAVLGGCLCIVHNQMRGGHVDVWEMKEHGVKESWTKLFVIQLQVERLRPLGCTINGDELVMVIDRCQLVAYNLKTKEQRIIFATFKDYGFLVAAYLESLVSP